MRHILAGNFRQLRKAMNLTQDNLAEDANYLGIAWHASTVADIEAGRRGLTAEEMILIPGLLGAELADLLDHPGPKVQVGNFEIELEDVVKLISGRAAEVHLPRIVRGGPVTLRPTQYLRDRLEQEADFLVKREGEAHAVRVLSRDPIEVLEACFRLWDRPLSEERERRIEESGVRGNLPRQRGGVTRELIGELRRYFEDG